MKRAGRGTIINVTSTTVDRVYPTGMVAYITAKAGTIGLTARWREPASSASR